MLMDVAFLRDVICHTQDKLFIHFRFGTFGHLANIEGFLNDSKSKNQII
jgi:hypothetical protein